MSTDELAHHYRVIDQSITAHSELRDRLQRRSAALDIFLLVASVVLCATVFMNPDILEVIGISGSVVDIARRLSSVAILLVSVVALRVDWKRRSEGHARAAEALAKLKSDCRRLLKSTSDPDPREVEQLCRACTMTFDAVAKIPENKFLGLKSSHKRKVELSRFVDEHPGRSFWLLKLQFWAKSNFRREVDVEAGPADEETLDD